MIGLTGAHRTGKTTLAEAFAQAVGIAFVRTSGSEVFRIIGRDPKAEYPIEERIAIQEGILYAFEKQYAHAASVSPVFVADRCPIDLAGYMLADVQRSTLAGDPDVAVMVNDYVRRCLESTNRWFGTVVLVQPGIALVEAEGKAPACLAFMEHLNALQAGLLVDERFESLHFMMPRRVTNLAQRVEALRNASLSALQSTAQMHCQLAKAGIQQH